MRRLTATQSDILRTVRTVRDLNIRKCVEVLDWVPDAKPSNWVSACHLESAFKIRARELRSLVKKGYLEMRPTDGFGPEVRLVEAAPVWVVGNGCLVRKASDGRRARAFVNTDGTTTKYTVRLYADGDEFTATGNDLEAAWVELNEMARWAKAKRDALNEVESR